MYDIERVTRLLAEELEQSDGRLPKTAGYLDGEAAWQQLFPDRKSDAAWKSAQTSSQSEQTVPFASAPFARTSSALWPVAPGPNASQSQAGGLLGPVPPPVLPSAWPDNGFAQAISAPSTDEGFSAQSDAAAGRGRSEVEWAQDAFSAAARRRLREVRGPAVQPYASPAPAPAFDPQNPGLIERTRLNGVDAFYRGTLTGAALLAGMQYYASTPDEEGIHSKTKRWRDQLRSEYSQVVADLARYDQMRGYSGWGEGAAALLGQLGGSLPSPESFIGVGAKGGHLFWKLAKAGLTQGGVNAATDPVVQGLNIQAGVRDAYDPWRTGMSVGLGALLGGTIQGGVEWAGHGSARPSRREVTTSDAPDPNTSAGNFVSPQTPLVNIATAEPLPGRLWTPESSLIYPATTSRLLTPEEIAHAQLAVPEIVKGWEPLAPNIIIPSNAERNYFGARRGDWDSVDIPSELETLGVIRGKTGWLKDLAKSRGSQSIFNSTIPFLANSLRNDVPQVPLQRPPSPETGIPDRISRLYEPATVARNKELAYSKLDEGYAWNNINQVRDLSIELFGPERGEAEFRLWNYLLGIGSIGTDVEQATRRASYYNYLIKSGRLNVINKMPYPYGSYMDSLQGRKIREFLDEGELKSEVDRKTAAMVENGLGNLVPVKLDRHNMRTLGLRNSKGEFLRAPAADEYGLIEKYIAWLGAEMGGVPPAVVMDAIWLANASATGVRPTSLQPLIATFGDKIAFGAKLRNMSVEDFARELFEGRKTLLSLGATSAGAGIAASGAVPQE